MKAKLEKLEIILIHRSLNKHQNTFLSSSSSSSSFASIAKVYCFLFITIAQRCLSLSYLARWKWFPVIYQYKRLPHKQWSSQRCATFRYLISRTIQIQAATTPQTIGDRNWRYLEELSKKPMRCFSWQLRWKSLKNLIFSKKPPTKKATTSSTHRKSLQSLIYRWDKWTFSTSTGSPSVSWIIGRTSYSPCFETPIKPKKNYWEKARPRIYLGLSSTRSLSSTVYASINRR